MSFSETISPFLGRCALVWFYAAAAMTIVNDWQRVQGMLDARHVPLAPVLLVVALVFIFLGCVSLLLGYHARYGAVMLFGLTIVAAVTLHPFWLMDAGRQAEFEVFARDVAICGGLLLMVGMGPGPFAIDNRGSGGGKGGGGKGRR
jgi:putative oxidoreductase